MADVKNSPDRVAALENALKQIDRQFGKGTIMRLGEQEKLEMELIWRVKNFRKPKKL